MTEWDVGPLRAPRFAVRWDLVDVVDVLSGLGCRIGELLALDWATSVDFDAGTARFHGTVIRAHEIADYLGHERISTTQEDYMERGAVGEGAGPALGERPTITPPKSEGQAWGGSA